MALAELSGNLIGARGRSGNGGNAHKVGFDALGIDVVYSLVDNVHARRNLGRDERCQGSQRKRSVPHGLFPDAAAMPVEGTTWAEKDNTQLGADFRVLAGGIPENCRYCVSYARWMNFNNGDEVAPLSSALHGRV